MSGFVIGLLGAESTGKTTLSVAIAESLRAEGRHVAVVPEYLREFCERSGRTPTPDEQHGIAAEQTRRIAEAADAHDVVVADTTALMIAVYSDWVFADRSLYDAAIVDHRRCDATLLTAVDIPWQADGLQREGPHVQGPIDRLIRGALMRGNINHSIIFGQGDARVTAAMSAVRRAMSTDDDRPATRWQWHCEHCGDNACERRLFNGDAE